jgi:hypothetical protein
MRVVVAVGRKVMLVQPRLEQVVLVVVLTAHRQELFQLLRLQTLVVEEAAQAMEALHHMQAAAQAALVLSSSNTQHLLNPYSHSKVLAHGSHLLA